MHLKIKADPEEDALMTVTVKGISEYEKQTVTKYRAGGRGVISYRMV